MKNNRKGFTLIELLAVIVILAILVTLTVPALTKYIESSRKNTFYINTERILDQIRLDVVQHPTITEKTYTLSQINELLESNKRLVKSSYGNNYDPTSYIKVTYTNNQPTFEICIVDSKGNGIYKESEISKEKVTKGILSKCGIPKVEYAKSFGGTGIDSVQSVAATSDGGNIAVGSFEVTKTIDAIETTSNTAITLKNAGRYDAFIIKYNSAGKVEYAKSFGGTGNDYAYSTAASSDGGYIVTGFYSCSTITIGAEDTANNSAITLTRNGNNSSIFIIKYNSNNKVEWAKSIGGATQEYARSVAITSDGGYIVAGDYISSTITIVAGDTVNNSAITLTKTGSQYTSNMFIIKYNSTGKVEYAKSISGAANNYTYVSSVATDSDGGYIVSGNYNGGSIIIATEDTKNNSTITLANAGSNDGFIIKYNSAGKVEYAKSISGTGDEYIYSSTVTKANEYIAVGSYNTATVTIPAGETENNSAITLTNASNSFDSFIIKYNNSGKVEYAKSIGGTDWDEICSVVATLDGGYIVAGRKNKSTVTIPAGETVSNSTITLANAGSNDGFIIKYNSAGKVEYAKSISGTGDEYVRSVSETKDGGYIVTGTYYNPPPTIAAGDTKNNTDITFTNSNTTDSFFIKYSY